VLTQRVQIRRREEIIRIQHQISLAGQMRKARTKRIPRPPRHLLPHRRPLPDMLLPPQVLLNLLRQIIDNDHQPIHALRQRPKDPVEDRPPLHGQQRLGRLLRVRSQPGAQAGGEDNGFHYNPFRLHIRCSLTAPAAPSTNPVRFNLPGLT